jgi:hypothetical protein
MIRKVQTTPPLKLLLSSRESARALSISERTLWTLTNEGKLPVCKVRGANRYHIDDLLAYIDASKTETRTTIEKTAPGGCYARCGSLILSKPLPSNHRKDADMINPNDNGREPRRLFTHGNGDDVQLSLFDANTATKQTRAIACAAAMAKGPSRRERCYDYALRQGTQRLHR